MSDTTKAPLFTSETSSVSSTPLFNNNISQNEEDVNTDNKKYVNYTSKIENSTHIRYNFIEKNYNDRERTLSKI